MRHRPEYIAAQQTMTRLRVRDLDAPVAAVGVTDSGSFAVVADPSVPPRALGHALDYADRLAELIPEQDRGEYRTAS